MIVNFVRPDGVKEIHEHTIPAGLLMELSIAISFLALIAACLPKLEDKPIEPSMPKPPLAASTRSHSNAPQSIDELKLAIAKILTEDHIPGIGIALVNKRRVIWTGGIGKADLQSGRDMTADTMFRIGSITKGFVALSLLQLQEKRRISLDTKVADIAPEIEIANSWEKTDPVRVANLLEHTAGFDDFTPEEFYDFRGSPELPLAQIFRSFPGPQHVRWRPGTLAAYSNPGYGLAGYLVQKASGKSYEEYIADNILRPLGMMHSDMRLTPEVRAALAQGYEWEPPRPVPYYPIYLRPAGEMKSSPAEMARFVRLLLNRGELDGLRIVSADSVDRMETPKTGFAARAGLRYGYGLGNLAFLSGQFIAHGHDGGLDGFHSLYSYMTELGVGFFFSINDTGPRSARAFEKISEAITNYLTTGLKPPPKPAAIPLDSTIAQWTGYYEYASPRRNGFNFFLQNLLAGGWVYIVRGKLYARGLIPGPRLELIFLGHNQIRTEKDLAATGVFLADDEGNRYGCGTLNCFHKTNAVWPAIRLALIASALVVMASSIVFAVIWVPRKLFGRMRTVRHLQVRALPLAAALTFAGTFIEIFLSDLPVIETARPSWISMTILAGSMTFALLSVGSLLVAVRSFRYDMNRAVRFHSFLVAASCFGITAYLAFWGVIGVPTWRLF